MTLRLTIVSLAILTIMGCKGPETRSADTAVRTPGAPAAETTFAPPDTALATTGAAQPQPDREPQPVAKTPAPEPASTTASATKAEPTKAAATKAPATPAVSPSQNAGTAAVASRETTAALVARETTAVVPTPVTKVPEPTAPVLRDSPIPLHPAYTPGEVLEYQVKFGSISVGKAVLEVVGLDTIRGIPAIHVRLRVEGKMGFVGVKDRYETWIDPRTMSSLRYVQDIDEATYERVRHYEIYPDRKTYHEKGKKELPSVAAPLDDASFLVFMRTIPLTVGETYSFDRYFKPDRNPVRVTVMRKEEVKVPAGTFSTYVVRPIIKTTGLFSEGGKAEVWFSDDESRLLVQLKTQMKIGSLNLFLRKVKRPVPAAP